MTVMAQAPPAWPEGAVFWTPQRIPFQVEHIALAFVLKQAMLVWDTGIGKSVAALGVAGLAVENGTAGQIITVCEPNKLEEWRQDFARFTRIEDVAVYHGAGRKSLAESLPRVIITTYETLKADAVVFETSLRIRPGFLLEKLCGKSVLVIYDEISKLASRSSRNYKAHHWLMAQLRKSSPEVRVIGLTGTPVKTEATENMFNEMRVIAPHLMPTVSEFNARCVKYRDEYRRPVYNPDGVAWFRDICKSRVLRLRKSDPEVRDYFPPFVEEFIRCQMHGDQRGLYRRLENLAWDEEGRFQAVPGLAMLLRQLAGDPLAILETARHGSSALAKMVAEELGEELGRCSSAKAEILMHHLAMIREQGHKVIVFTFFGQSVLPVIARRLENHHHVIVYHGQMARQQQDQAVASFRAHRGPAVLLASDSASRGINVPEADYTIEYEVAFTHHTRTQRAGRGHRILGVNPHTFMSLVLERSIEYRRTLPRLLDRNEQQDYILGDVDAQGFVTGADRRLMFAMAKSRKLG